MATDPKPVRAPRRRLRPGPVVAVGLATFTISLSLLGWQVAVGRDPSLGHGKQKPKVVHRKIERTVVHRVYDPPEVIYVAPESTYDGGDSQGGYSSGGSSGGGYSGGGSSGGVSSGGSYGGGSYSAPAPSPPPVSSGAS